MKSFSLWYADTASSYDLKKREKMSVENALLVVSFGTTATESLRLNIGSVEQKIEEAAGGSWSVRRCFTSQTIINILEKKKKIKVDSINEALERAAADGVNNLVVQPTHLMKGLEYDKLCSTLADHAGSFRNTAVGDPLLTSEDDLDRVAEALIEASAGYEDGETALVFMGHGTEADANGIYKKLQCVLGGKGKTGYYIGTVEAEPALDDVIKAVGEGNIKRVVLRPLMLVAGNHAVNDMASPDDPDSWYSRFSAEGYETICIIEGLGQLSAVRDIYADHANRPIASLNGQL
jgi:sirohydrochlorin cobaltochelatase